MSGLVLCEPTELYNILNQATFFPCLSDPNYLLLLDARKKHEYNESHVVTSKKAPKDGDGSLVVPYDAELECKQHVIIYDSNTRNLKDEGPAIECGKVMWGNGSRNPVKILRGGYEDFSALYPFLRTQKILFMPKELDEIKTYPTEILPGLLYLGNLRQGNAAYIQKDLKIKAQINCTPNQGELFKEPGPTLMHIPIVDNDESDVLSKFETACTFIDEHKENKQNVLVFSDLGISRSASIALAYLMHHYKWPLKEAYEHCQKCCHNIRPNRGFVEQLSKWEVELYGEQMTDITDPSF